MSATATTKTRRGKTRNTWFYHPDWDLEHQAEFAVNSLGVVGHLLGGEKYLSLDEQTIEAAGNVALLAQEALEALDLPGAAMTGMIRLRRGKM